MLGSSVELTTIVRFMAASKVLGEETVNGGGAAGAQEEEQK
jgi:hypothetical protein